MATGYGTDLQCTDALSSVRFDSGKAVVAHALYRRLITPRGTLRGGDEESAYGFDLTEFIGVVGTQVALVTLPGRIKAECLKDDRVQSVVVSVSLSGTDEQTLAVDIQGVLSETGEEFVLTLEASDVGVELLRGVQ